VKDQKVAVVAIAVEKDQEEAAIFETILSLEACLHVIVNSSLRVEAMKNPKVKNNKAKNEDPNLDLLAVTKRNQQVEVRLASDNSRNL
jgi:hypothetical protein